MEWWSSTPIGVVVLAAVVLAAVVTFTLRRAGKRRVRLGVVCMTKRPLDFFAWLRHHRELGVEHFFLRIEDTPDLLEALTRAPYEHYVTCIAGTGEREYYKQVNRQQDLVDRAICKARHVGLTHLMHIDDDELLHCPTGRNALDAFLRSASRTSCLVVQNIEAVFDVERCESVFGGTTTFCTNPSAFTAYANGKSVGALHDPSLRSLGAHRFSGSVGAIPSHVLLVLHYESPCIRRWRQKFESYAARNGSACLTGDIPFPFYCESMNEPTDATWRKWKSPSRHAREDLLNITLKSA